jgi:hypothetical protein
MTNDESPRVKRSIIVVVLAHLFQTAGAALFIAAGYWQSNFVFVAAVPLLLVSTLELIYWYKADAWRARYPWLR